MVQSVGMMIEANWRLMDNKKIIESLRRLYLGVHKDFFGYQDDGHPALFSISINFKVAQRKVINESLLPNLAPCRDTLDELKRQFDDDKREWGLGPINISYGINAAS